jgi:hypothetical protein
MANIKKGAERIAQRSFKCCTKNTKILVLGIIALLLDLMDGSIVPCKIEGSKALAAIFLAIEPLELKHRKGWDLN